MNHDDQARTRCEVSEDNRCPNCGGGPIQSEQIEDRFVYGDGPDAVTLTARVMRHLCRNCRFEFLDATAEDAHHQAICRHLGVLTPSEIRAIRLRNGPSRSSFAELTKLGEATIARWERGELVQNGAYDQLLYLLTFEDNVSRLKSRATAIQSSLRPSTGSAAPRFRVLQPTDREREMACGFELRPMRRTC